MRRQEQRANGAERPHDARKRSDEIAAEDELDGELFRAATVTITDGQRQVHRGVESEAAIHQLLNEFLATVNSAEENRLIRILASHFMFEFVHPFYDGNGRMGRFLLSVALREALSTATALTISRQLAEVRRSTTRLLPLRKTR